METSIIILLTFHIYWCFIVVVIIANPDAKRLYEELIQIRAYNKLIRPVKHHSERLTVYLGLRLTQLLDVDEKNQIMTTNVWLKQLWMDEHLKWDPIHFNNITNISLPASAIWRPDLALLNNADGNYEVNLMTKATVYYNGRVIWEPPAIYKSSCTINVEFIPFDIQHCQMKFGSRTYSGEQVDIVHINQTNGFIPVYGNNNIAYAIDLADFYRSVEWDIMEVPATRNVQKYPCCPQTYPDITFLITLRRKTLFHTVNFIIPCVGISFLTILTFYLPSDSGEKVTLCISILVSLTVFILLLAELIPPTSLVVPLIGKYVLFTMILVTLSILVTVVVLNVHFRSPSTHQMPTWVRRVFLHVLPKLLLVRRPKSINPLDLHLATMNRNRIKQSNRMTAINFELPLVNLGRYQIRKKNLRLLGEFDSNQTEQTEYSNEPPLCPNEIKQVFEGLKRIAAQIKLDDEEKTIKEEWKYVALVIDRLFLYIFTTACFAGTCGIILQAPSIYDYRKPIDLIKSNRF
ncbi:unnamed protein product [Rotaria socialis]|uniref:Uncharacterized protein n=1 Tax=Rotaria socialis TaxID=392032 RepID=A0A820RIX9_9BILA|nr:unnamed protein product [Rotaria socialis]CAF4436273.1 unnamed protein product [Rotaria socialis]